MKLFGAQNMVEPLKKVLMKKPLPLMSKADCIKWNYEKNLNQNLLEKNYFELHKIIKESNIEIFYLDHQNENKELFDLIFTHDPSLCINDGAIILNMTKSLRVDEVILHEAFYKSLNIPIIGRISGKGKVEGGDCLWINESNLLVGESSRTNIEGINQLKKILKEFNITVIPVKIPIIDNNNSCFHLMSLVSMLDNDLIIGYDKFISNDLVKIFNKNNIKVISIPEDDYLISKSLAINILALSPRNLIMLKGYNKTAELLINHNCKLNFFDGNELCIKAEGGPTCLTRPLLR